MQKAARLRSPATKSAPPAGGRARLAVLVLALMLSCGAGWQAWSSWCGLPGVRLAHFTRADYERAQRATEASMSRAARQALIAANISHLFTGALQDPELYPTQHDTLQRMLAEMRDTQLGRLQLAAFLMLEMERAAIPPERWWPRLQPVLSGLEQARFPHFLPDLEANREQMYGAMGLSFDAARDQAEEAVGHPHGPFLEYLAPRLAKLAQVRASAADDSDALCRRLYLRLLREWTLEDGPPGLRMLAADLLASAITAGDVPIADPQSSARTAEQLRQWRATYRAAAAARGPLPYPLGIGHTPDQHPQSSRRLVALLMLRLWVLGGLCGAVLIGLIGLAVARSAFLALPNRKLNYLLLVGTAAVVAAGAVAWINTAAMGFEDVRRLAGETAGLPRTILAAFLVSVVSLLLAAFPGSIAGEPGRARAGRVAVVAVWFLALLGLCSLALGRGGSDPGDSRSELDRVARVAGADSVHLLDTLQAWQP